MKALQAKLNRLVQNLDIPIAVILEGRDTAGKSSTIRELTHYLCPDWYSIVPSKKPSKSTMDNWLFYWQNKLPTENKIVFYDRSWYSRALVQQLNGWCTARQYDNFMRDHMEWETSQNILIIKFWLSISEAEQTARIQARKTSPLTSWKFSDNDELALSNYDKMSILKERVITSDWHVIDYNIKSLGIKKLLEVLCAVIEARKTPGKSKA